MRKILCTLLALVGLAGSLQAVQDMDSRWEMEVRAGGFHPSWHRFREIYGDWSGNYEFQMAYVFAHNWSAWANVAYTPSDGHSSLGDDTHIRIVPLTWGLIGTYWFTCTFGGYVGLGPSYAWLRIHDESPFVIQHTHRSGWGGIGKLGLKWIFAENGLLDIFGDYSYQPFHFHNEHGLLRPHFTNVGGWRLGLGLGVTW